MESVMATLADKDQSFVRTVRCVGISTHRACLTAKVGVHFHGHRACKCSFVSNVAMQFSKGPLRGMLVGPALLLARFLSSFALRPFADVGQGFQADETVWVLLYNAATDLMVAILFQPSLSSTHHYQTAGRGTSAFLLQPFSQACIMICFGSHLFASIEGGGILGSCCDCQVALSNIHPHHFLVALRSWVGHLNLKCHEQVELLAGLIIPEFSGSYRGSVLEECDMLAISRVGNNHSSLKSENAHLLVWLQAIISMIVVGEGRGNILGSVIQSLVAFLGMACLTLCRILLGLGPQGFVGGSHLARDVTGHLRRQVIGHAYLCIHLPLQGPLVADLAMLIRIARHRVQGITVGQLGRAQGSELRRR